jgi:hypothetical protein
MTKIFLIERGKIKETGYKNQGKRPQKYLRK